MPTFRILKAFESRFTPHRGKTVTHFLLLRHFGGPYSSLLEDLCSGFLRPKINVLRGRNSVHSYFVVLFKCEGENSCHDLLSMDSWAMAKKKL